MQPLSRRILTILALFFIISFGIKADLKNEKSLQRLQQIITFPQIDNKTCKDSIITLNATSSSGLPVTFFLKLGNGILIDNLLTITGPGTIIIEAQQAGNDIYEPADVQTVIFDVTSTFYNSLSHLISAKSSNCEGDSLKFSTTSLPGIFYSWTDPFNKVYNSHILNIPNASTSLTGIYKLRVWEYKCIYINNTSHSVTVHPKPVITLSGLSTQLFQSNSAVQISAFPTGGIFSGPGIEGSLFKPQVAGVGNHIITYSVSDIHNCKSSKEAFTIVSKPPIPSKNDIEIYQLINSKQESKHKVWLIENIENYPDNEVMVYNSWGDLVYNKRGYKNETAWDAQGFSSGSYLYVVKPNNSDIVYRGTLFIDK